MAGSVGILATELVLLAAGSPRAAGMPTGPPVVVAAALIPALAIGARRWYRERRPAQSAPGDFVSVIDLAATHGERAPLDATVSALTQALDRASETSAMPLAIHVGDELVEVFWDRPPPPPTRPFRPAPSGWVWTTTAEGLIEHLPTAGEPSPPLMLPALVYAGATGLGELWMNLEATRVLHLVGSSESAESVAASLVARLPRASVDVMVVDTPRRPLPSPDAGDAGDVGERVGLDAALVEARRRRAHLRRHLEALEARSVLVARRRDPGSEQCRPLVVVHLGGEGATDPESFARLARAAQGERSGVVGLFVGEAPPVDRVTLACAERSFTVPFLEGITVALSDDRDDPKATSEPGEPCEPDGAEEGGVDASTRAASFADQALHVDVVGVPAVPIPPSPTRERSQRDGASESVPDPQDSEPAADGGVDVRLLGPVEIVGSRSPLGGKSAELVAYLACHRDGVSDERIKSVLWPERPVTHQTWLNRVSGCRNALGTDASGGPALPHFEDGIGRLGASVGCDVDRLEAALIAARQEPEQTGDGEALRVALAAVRGRPFDERSGYEWAFAELHVAHAERIVTEAALIVVDRALAGGDWDRARWAAEQGLVAVPASEPLTCARMRAFAAGGDLGGVHRAMRDLLAGIGGDDPEAEVHPETLDLYQQLCAPARSPSAWASASTRR